MSSNPRRFVLRAGAVLGVATIGVLAGTGIASAHVIATPPTAEQSSYEVIKFRVPDESDTASTIKLVVTIPKDKPFSSVRTAPLPGWTSTMTKETLNPPVTGVGGRQITEAVTSVTWTAAPGYKIAPGQYMEFPIYLGSFPSDATSVMFPAVQTYDNGDVVAWDQPTVPGQDEPEHPAPTVALTPSTGGDEHAGMAMGSSAAVEPTAATSSDSDSTARWLGGAGLLVGALGLGVGGGALLRGRKKTDA